MVKEDIIHQAQHFPVYFKPGYWQLLHGKLISISLQCLQSVNVHFLR